MTPRSVQLQIKSHEVSEGAGVTVHRSIGTPALKQLDPFLMLDHFGSDNPDEYIAGFPEHPHRGFNTFTYMLDGHMEHRDSMGNRGDLQAGGAQWMKAASGVLHSEMPQQSNGLMRGFQLWVNLPASQKMTEPEYQEFSTEAFPVVASPGQRVKVLAGEYLATPHGVEAGVRGPVQDPHTQVLYLDVTLSANEFWVASVPNGHHAFLYFFEGEGEIAQTAIPTHALAVLADGDLVQVRAGMQGARFILVAGKPLNEPVVQYGPFVMNTREEIEQAFADYRAGTLVQTRAAMVRG